MASETAPNSKNPRRLRGALAFGTGALVLLFAVCAWLAGTQSGARAVFSALGTFSGGMLHTQDVQGRLTGPLRIGSLTFMQPDRRISLTDLRVDWLPRALLDKKLHITSLYLGHLGIINKDDKKKEPIKLPEQIALPFALQADDVQLARGEISRETSGKAASLLKFGPLALSLGFDGNVYSLRLREFAAGSTLDKGGITTRFSGQATLNAAKPYAIEGNFSSTGNAAIDERNIGAEGAIRLSGSLAELSTKLDFTVWQARLQGNTVLQPFSEQILGTTQLTARSLDIASIDQKLPHTSLDIDFSLAENGPGELKVNNTGAGTYDRQRVPLASLWVRFHQNGSQIQLDRILAHSGTAQHPAGAISGSGRYADGALALTLQTESLDLQKLDARMRQTHLAGQVDLHHADGQQEFTIGLSEPLQRQRIALAAHGVLADTGLTLDRAELQAGEGRINATAHVALTGQQSFNAQGKISRFWLEDLGSFPQAPQLLLNGEFSLRGLRQPQLEADLAFHIFDSRLAGQPLFGDGKAQLRGETLQVPHLLLASGDNRLSVEGQLSQADSQLRFSLNAPQLAQLGPKFGGAVKAEGVVRGTLNQPRIVAEWSASNARLPGDVQMESMQGKADIRIDRKQPFILQNAVADFSARGLRYGAQKLNSLAAQLHFAPQPDAPLTLTLHGDGIVAERLHAERFSATATGTTARHAIDMMLKEPGKPEQNWSLHADGGLAQLASAPIWQGSINRFDADGKIHAQMTSTAALLLSAQRIRLENLQLDTDAGHIAVAEFSRDPAGITTRGRLDNLQLAQLLRYRPETPVKTDLILGGEWNVRIAETLSGTVNMRRERGDMTILGATPLALGLRNLSANVNADRGRLMLALQTDGQQLGRIDINASTTAGNGPTRLSVAPDTPVSGNAHVDVPSLRWLAPLISPSLVVDGRLKSDVSLGGTFAQPRFTGMIAGDALRLVGTDLGLDLRQGVLESNFDGERLLIRNLSFQGTQGRVAVSGPIDFSGGKLDAQLALTAERFALLNRTDRKLVLSGESRLSLQDQNASISGAFTVNSGFFDIGSQGKPELSDDVVIIGKQKKAATKTRSAIDIAIALGDGVTVRGRGLDAVLVGKGRILSEPGQTLRAEGTLSVAKGTYKAYGRELQIEQGLLRFSGPLNNPALDILAMRRGQEVEAGVSVGGTVLQPRVTLISEPVVPDSEKLSWLVLGRGLSSAGEADAGVLQAAAAALLSDSAQASVQSRIASAFGLDTFSVGTSEDTLQQRIVTLGKQISSRLYLSYQQGLESAGSVVQLRYTLSPKLSLEAEAGTRSAISLFYNIAFD
ncbi:MAG TPA: translocation/assembly module TamB domain-containing protein [Noviherbaspirillum sp.]|nr:translocation/assembly module TamB domain-containing protein [Noviherbaspirillum sp.]